MIAAPTLAHLERLVACDTQNPPRAAAGVARLFAYASEIIEPLGFTVVIRDLGDGCQWLWASRGEGAPPVVNVHIDTVPAHEGWSRDPFSLHVEGDKAVGLGACDIKGALAAWLVAASRTSGPAALLLTSDEEAGDSRCVRTFVVDHDVKGREVLVAEPTGTMAVVAHRGIGTCTGRFTGTSGHASSPRALQDSALHELVRWGARALERSAAVDARLNLGTIEGGIKSNMIAGSAAVRFGVRPLRDPAAVITELCALAEDPSRVSWEPGFLAPALSASSAARALAKRWSIEEAPPVDFFTEAAFFQAAGATALVVGPGDIGQAHTADEHVALAQLQAMEGIYARLLGGAS